MALVASMVYVSVIHPVAESGEMSLVTPAPKVASAEPFKDKWLPFIVGVYAFPSMAATGGQFQAV